MQTRNIILNQFMEFGRVKSGDILRRKNFLEIFNKHPKIDNEEFNETISELVIEGILTMKSKWVFEVTPLGEELLRE